MGRARRAPEERPRGDGGSRWTLSAYVATRMVIATPSSAPFWALTEAEAIAQTESRSSGLSSEVALARKRGASSRFPEQHTSTAHLLVRQFRNPIVVLLSATTLLSVFLRDATDAAIIGAIIIGSGVLGFFQERGAVRAVQSLMASVRVHVEVVRDGALTTVPVADVVRGDVVAFNAGDIVPGDCLVLEANSLQADESALTGESFPQEKRPGPAGETRSNALFLGTHIVSGKGLGLVMETGRATEFGRISAHLAKQHVPTSFERGITAFGYLLVRATIALVALIFVLNLALNRPFVESVLFSLALAIGLTPQMLPAIVTLSLAHGARAMARQKAIVKRLDAIEDIGAMDILCTDKTGTLTSGTIRLDLALDAQGVESPEVRELAWLNARHQGGFENPIDTAILEAIEPPTDAGKAHGEVPFDFSRRRVSVLVDQGGRRRLITKGAFEPVLALCGAGGQAAELTARFEALSAEGYRVLAVAFREWGDSTEEVGQESERDLQFGGFLAFADPPKPGIRDVVAGMGERGVRTCMITGDNRHSARRLASLVGLEGGDVVCGDELAGMTDEALRLVLPRAAAFAEVDPIQKERIVRAFAAAGHTVGYLGDGINDAPALHVADVGISVDGAVDVAKHTADLVLLEKDLRVLDAGIEEGRRVFVNTLKCVFVTTSANFGNMLSMAGAAAFLPFLPLLPRQILLLNFLSDIPGTTIAADRVSPEQVDRPRTWNITQVRNFMIVFGLISTAFDYVTFGVLRFGFDAGADAFRTTWFVTSMTTELAAMLVLRTAGFSLRSRPGNALLLSSLAVLAITFVIPFGPAGKALGFVNLEPWVVGLVIGVTGAYVALTESVKRAAPGLMR